MSLFSLQSEAGPVFPRSQQLPSLQEENIECFTVWKGGEVFSPLFVSLVLLNAGMVEVSLNSKQELNA